MMEGIIGLFRKADRIYSAVEVMTNDSGVMQSVNATSVLSS